ncbi:MAG: CDP-alcohol phosphatidyltransferase family protein [Phycisphaerae bacterium]|nr:CDP-alcohol phosphatidyltransferase family protein [Phycisphaerae bacterium]
MPNSLSNQITAGLMWTRDRLARGLVAVGVRPNHLTLVGLVWTIAAAGCLAVGLARADGSGDTPPPWFAGRANWWLWAAAGFIILAGAMDILDGAVARLGQLATETGAFLDSTLDRFSDIALFAGMAAGFAWRNNFTYTLLAVLAMGYAVLISYTRARAEDLIANCKVGYWERGERIAAILIAAAFYQVPAVLWQLATLPMLTALRRIVYTLRVTAHRARTGEDLSVTQVKPIGGGIYKLALWRYPRGTIAYDIVTGANILWIILAPIGGVSDPIRRWIVAIAG